MGMDLKGYTCPVEMVAPKDRAATHYSTPICVTGYRSLAIVQNVQTLTTGSASITGSVEYGASSGLGTYDYKTAGDTWVTFRYNTDDQIKLAHTFTTASGSTPTFVSVRVKMKAVGTLAASKFVWAQIDGDSSGPDNAALATSFKIPVNGITTAAAGEWVTFTFREVPPLVAATKYYVVLQGDWTLSTSNHLAIHVDTVASGGTLWVYDTGWVNTTTQSPNTDCIVVATWTDIAANVFTAVTNTTMNQASTALQEQIVDTKLYGDYVHYVGTETASWTTCLSAVFGYLGDPVCPGA